MPLFTTLTEESICKQIDAATKHVVLAAPGCGMAVAQSLVEAHQRLGADAVQVVLDVSARVMRLGYGDHAAAESLRAAGVQLRQHEGLRIGALICDDAGWSFASVPRLVEADPTADGDAFNAIALTSAQVMVLRSELPPVGVSTQAPEYAVVGSHLVQEDELAKVKRALDIAPPQQFDLARQTQVYAALIQFVELSFEGFNIQSRRIRLPKTLPLIASQDKALKERVTTSLKVLDKLEKPKELQDVSQRLEELRESFLVPVGQAGRVMLKSKQKLFEDELAKIQTDLDACKEALKKDLQEALDKVVASIVPDMARAVLADQPPRFKGMFSNTLDAAADYVRAELDKAFPSASAMVTGMKIHKFYKDVTYETLKNKEFVERVSNEIPRSVMEGSLLKEEVAVKAEIFN
jgi:hypothetical protein